MKAFPSFLTGGGEMGALIREHDWSASPLGPTEQWPQSLRTAVRLMLNTRHPMYIFWGAQGSCLYNDAYRPSIGSERHPASLGQPASQVWAEIWPIIGPQIEQVMQGRGATWHENQLVPITRGGRREDVYWTYSFGPIDEESAPGGIGGVLVVCTETTQQVLSEQRTVAKLQRQQALLEQMPGFVAMLAGPHHVYEYVNAAYVTVAGPREYIGRQVRQVFPELEGQGFFELLDGVYASGKPFAARAVPIQLAGDAEQRFIDLLHEPIRDEFGTVTGIFVGGYDISERVRAQNALQQVNATLEQRVALAVSERKKVEANLVQAQKMEAVGQLTGGLAHDFNNLLMGITGALELMRLRTAQGRSDEIARYISSAQDAAKRAAALTHRLLAFSRRQTLEPKVTDINRLVTGMEELIQRSIGPEIALQRLAGVALWTTRVDQSQLENALLNLCINARDAMPEGGKLVIETANRRLDERAAGELDLPAGNYVALSVSDNGTGMAPEVAARAFDPFFTTKAIGQGTGLGLSMIYGFARQSGGQVGIESLPGQGATVSLYLPRHDQQGEISQEQEPAAVASTAVRGKTVLVVEDEPSVRMLVVDVLHELGYGVAEASDSRAGLLALQGTGRIDLLISDVGLPGGLNGRQLADAGRALRPGLKVLFITGYAQSAVLGPAHIDSNTRVLTKPFDLDVLAERIRELAA